MQASPSGGTWTRQLFVSANPTKAGGRGVGFPYPMRFTEWEGTGARGSPPKVKFLSLWAWHPDSF